MNKKKLSREQFEDLYRKAWEAMRVEEAKDPRQKERLHYPFELAQANGKLGGRPKKKLED